MRRSASLVLTALVLSATAAPAEEGEWRPLLSPTLSENWEAWLGVPHASVSVPGYPPSTSADGKTGQPIGLVDADNDPIDLFTVREVDGEPVLRVSGEVYAGLTTKEVFKNYHVSLEFRWGERKWPPRLDKKRDSGLLMHAVGDHGAFWNAWMADIECQIQEGDCGDLHLLAGASGSVRTERPAEGDRQPPYRPDSDHVHNGSAKHGPSTEKPHGEWNTVEAYVVADTLVFVVNGTPNMAVHNTRYRGAPLTEGRIQLQSEGAEVFFRRVKIRPLERFPEFLLEHLRPIE